jgi:hypothetical protein
MQGSMIFVNALLWCSYHLTNVTSIHIKGKLSIVSLGLVGHLDRPWTISVLNALFCHWVKRTLSMIVFTIFIFKKIISWTLQFPVVSLNYMYAFSQVILVTTLKKALTHFINYKAKAKTGSVTFWVVMRVGSYPGMGNIRPHDLTINGTRTCNCSHGG